LSVDNEARADRLLSAAQAALMAGAPRQAHALHKQAIPDIRGGRRHAEARRLEGTIRFGVGLGAETPAILLDAARGLEPHDPGLARETLLEALEAAHYTRRPDGHGSLRDVARGARELSLGENHDQNIAELLLSGFCSLVVGERTIGAAQLARAIARLQDQREPAEQRLRWLRLGCLAAGELCDARAVTALAQMWVEFARDHGALTLLPVALNFLGVAKVPSGQLAAMEGHFDEGREISAAIGFPGVLGATAFGDLLVLAWRGEESSARASATAYKDEQVERGLRAGLSLGNFALGVLDLGLGDFESARNTLLTVYEEDAFYVGAHGLPDIVEAAMRSGDCELAELALARMEERAPASGTPMALGLLARARALVAGDGAAEAAYQESLGWLDAPATDLYRARTHLAYGEWLHRLRRRDEARDQLRAAHRIFEPLGAWAFAERTRAQLRAAGEYVGTRRPAAPVQLSPQEERIARLAVSRSNATIAAELFVSVSTVAYHLRSIYRKLGITSRSQLAETLTTESDAMSSPIGEARR
jgi:DNA-binding CsgD family transcriptional regulator